MGEISIHMGELAASADPAAMLVSIGLGSCIGVALVDAGAGVCGLAHIMLPGPGPGPDDAQRRPPGMFADTGVPALLHAVMALGARRVSAVLVGGAHMFGDAGRLRVGARNQDAVRAALGAVDVPVVAAETGGGSGRTIRVHVADACVTSRVAGAAETVLLGRTAVAA